MISTIAAIIGVLIIVIQALWKNRQRAKELDNEPKEDIRETQIAATAGDEQTVQQNFAAWDLAGRMRRPRDHGLRVFRGPPESGSRPR